MSFKTGGSTRLHIGASIIHSVHEHFGKQANATISCTDYWYKYNITTPYSLFIAIMRYTIYVAASQEIECANVKNVFFVKRQILKSRK